MLTGLTKLEMNSKDALEMDSKCRPGPRRKLESYIVSHSLFLILVQGADRDPSRSGSIPSEFGMLSGLKRLVLRANDLVEKIPSELGRLTELKMLDLSKCNLERSFNFNFNPKKVFSLCTMSFLYYRLECFNRYNTLGIGKYDRANQA